MPGTSSIGNDLGCTGWKDCCFLDFWFCRFWLYVDRICRSWFCHRVCRVLVWEIKFCISIRCSQNIYFAQPDKYSIETLPEITLARLESFTRDHHACPSVQLEIKSGIPIYIYLIYQHITFKTLNSLDTRGLLRWFLGNGPRGNDSKYHTVWWKGI